jgi:hypothetical protein
MKLSRPHISLTHVTMPADIARSASHGAGSSPGQVAVNARVRQHRLAS